ncbi:hypothetical protein Tco_0757687, partial [Tanacetum coccineum]
VTMPPITLLDHQKTRNYIPLISNEFNQPLRNTTVNLEKRYFHKGRVVSQNFENNESYVLYDSVMNPLTAQQERKPRKDSGTRRGRHSTSSSSAFDQPSSSHLNDDEDVNGEETSRASTPSPIRYVNLLTNQVLQVFQNPPNINPHLEPFYTRQIKIINRQVHIRDEQRGGLRSIWKGLRNLRRNIKK